MIVGRARELEAIDALVGADGSRAAALVLEGEPGIGKTAVWLEGIERARSAGLELLLARPAEGERSLPYAALGDLLERLLDNHASSLPEQQLRALETALQRITSGEPAEQLAVSRGTLALLRAAAAERPVLLARIFQ